MSIRNKYQNFSKIRDGDRKTNRHTGWLYSWQAERTFGSQDCSICENSQLWANLTARRAPKRWLLARFARGRWYIWIGYQFLWNLARTAIWLEQNSHCSISLAPSLLDCQNTWKDTNLSQIQPHSRYGAMASSSLRSLFYENIRSKHKFIEVSHFRQLLRSGSWWQSFQKLSAKNGKADSF